MLREDQGLLYPLEVDWHNTQDPLLAPSLVRDSLMPHNQWNNSNEHPLAQPHQAECHVVDALARNGRISHKQIFDSIPLAKSPYYPTIWSIVWYLLEKENMVVNHSAVGQKLGYNLIHTWCQRRHQVILQDFGYYTP